MRAYIGYIEINKVRHLRDIKIQHQSVSSILPKIVRKALKLSDYYETLRDIDIIDNENE